MEKMNASPEGGEGADPSKGNIVKKKKRRLSDQRGWK